MTGKTVEKLEQQIEDFLEGMEDLSGCTHLLSQPQRQRLAEEIAKFCQRLGSLQVAGEEVPASKVALNATCLGIEAERRRYQELFELAPDGYLVTDGEAGILEANCAAANLLKQNREHLLGKSLVDFIARSHRAKFRTQLSQSGSSENTREWEMPLAPVKGKSLRVNFTANPVRSSEGTVVGWRILLKHIADKHKSTQKQLKQQAKTIERLEQEIAQYKKEQQQSARLLNNPVTVSHIRTAQLERALNFEAMLKRITDKVRDSFDESQILHTAVQELVRVLGLRGCNAALYNIERATATISYEYTPDMPGTQGKVVPMTEFAEWYQQLLERQYFQFCIRIPGLGGEISILACPIVDNQRTLGDLWLFKQHEDTFNEVEIRLVQQVASQCAIAIRQARLYHAVEAQVTELEQLNRLKDEFLSTISHELRTPVANMKMAIQMLGINLNRELPFFDELAKPQAQQSKLARYFQILQNECDREINLINDVLDLQRLEGGKQPVALAAVQLSDWLPQLVAPFQERAEKRQQNLQLNISPTIPPFLCDQASLERIITELLNNACKYTPPNEQITVNASAKPGLIQLSFNNSGVEIPNSELSRIFDKFYRIPSTDPWKQGGTGLGLALVKKLVDHLGGIIEVKSQDNQTCFTVTLPDKLSPGIA
ncbi:MAG TPA: phosphoacceptor domain-containing protein [Cyanobacteria bacterium UBA11369]|nr:phosphoacceptor domain-containing protein [Cyanobacteria bacterium UBA11371]HBE32420.1 phosphoacceptor domain-containing protein [Cyanobacteria bacterium UBA11368]HBE53842.1 phosphoacceptor domain-containing protein [Cyanobacteria bacterium UBA11369]